MEPLPELVPPEGPRPPGTPEPHSNDPTSPVSPCSPTSQLSASDDNSSEMAPGGKQRPNTPKREADFSSLLTSNEKTELASLINKVTENIQKQLTQVFDSTGIDETVRPPRVSFWSGLPARLRDLSITTRPQGQIQSQRRTNNTRSLAADKENVNPSDSATVPPVAPETNGAPDHMTNNTEGAPLTPRLQELKKEWLVHFKKWQAAVIKRVGDISVKKTGDSQGSQSSGSGSRRGNSSKPSFNKGNNRSNGAMPAPRPSVMEHDFSLAKHYTPTPTSLSSLPLEKRILLLHALLLLFLSLENYTAYTRLLLLNIASSLHLPLRALAEDEVRVAKSLSQVVKDIPTEEVIQKKAEEGKSAKKWKVGLASMAGAAVVGITGGLAAPLVAAGIGSVLGGIGLGGSAAAGLLGAVAESGLVVGALFGIYGARASGKAMEQYTKDVDDFAFIPLRGSIGQDSEIGKIDTENRRLRVVLGISGWLDVETDVTSPWKVLGHQSEVYALRWELESLVKMGTALETVIRSVAWSMARKEIISRTSEAPKPKRGGKRKVAQKADKPSPVLACLQKAVWPLGLNKISKIIDNPWNVGMVRADKAGAVLADIIMNKAQGERGVTLIGFSLGARVIYSCLMSLAEKRAFGLVENAVLMGTPAPSDPQVWCTMKSVVSGRLVNVYSENDCILGFLYRTSSLQYGVAGLECIGGMDGIENVDVSAKVSGHLRYRYLAGSILKHIGWEDIDSSQVAMDEALLAKMETANRERERKRDALELASENRKQEQEVTKKKKEQEAIRTRARKNRGRR